MIACGCLSLLAFGALAAVIAVIILLPSLPQVIAPLAGLSPQGSTEQVFENATPFPTVVVQNAVEPPQVVIGLGEYGAHTLTTDTSYYDVAVGQSETGTSLATMTFTESSLLAACFDYSDICGTSNPMYQNTTIDLRPNGAIIYTDATLNFGVTTQRRVGVVLRLDPSRRQFEFAGVDLDGMLFDVPPGDISQVISDIENAGNDLLTRLTFNGGAAQMQLYEVQVTDDTLTLVLQ